MQLSRLPEYIRYRFPAHIKQRLLSPQAALLAVFVLPAAVIVRLAFLPSPDGTSSQSPELLAQLITNSALLGTLVLVLSVPQGVISAWLIHFYDFPGKRFFRWGLFLPFACPPYIVAFIYTDLLEFGGPVQKLLCRIADATECTQYKLPEVRTVYFAAVVLAVAFYPYVYMFCRAAIQRLPVGMVQVAAVSGYGMAETLWRVIIPSIRVPIFVGSGLVLMEVMSDYGTVEFFNVKTFTKAIYDTWLFESNLPKAASLALYLMGFIFLLVIFEKRIQQNVKIFVPKVKNAPFTPLPLSRVRGIAAFVFCALPILVGFVIPLGNLLISVFNSNSALFDKNIAQYAFNTFSIALPVVIICLYTAMAVEMYSFSVSRRQTKLLQSAYSMLYALPGTILGIALLIMFTSVDKFLAGILKQLWGIRPALFLSGSITIIIYAYWMRFFFLTAGNVENAFKQVPPNIDNSARLFGYGYFARLHKIYLPLFRNGLLATGTVIFSDAVKELSVILVIRPLNIETLATNVFQEAKAENFTAAAPGSLIIIAFGTIAAYITNRLLEKKTKSDFV